MAISKRYGVTAMMTMLGGAAMSNAHATEVTLYGIIDANIEAVSHNDPDSGTVKNFGLRSGGRSGSRFGFMGSEDLGNGTKAIFKLEAGFDVGNGESSHGGRLFGRQSYVGLKGDWGQLTLGRQNTPAFNFLTPYVPGLHGAQYEPVASLMPARADNSVAYAHKIGGLEFGGYYGFNSQADQRDRDLSTTGSFGLAATYEFNKTYGITAAYDQYRGTSNLKGTLAQGDRGNVENYMVVARAMYQHLQLRIGYRYRDTDLSVEGMKSVKSHMYMVGVGYQFKPGTVVSISYYNEHFKNAPQGWMNSKKDTVHQVSLLGTYGLSKRTELYAVASYSRNAPLNLGASSTYKLAEGTNSQIGGALGIRHRF